jgi:hypothetical protein
MRAVCREPDLYLVPAPTHTFVRRQVPKLLLSESAQALLDALGALNAS